jgi:hypothetical protein
MNDQLIAIKKERQKELNQMNIDEHDNEMAVDHDESELYRRKNFDLKFKIEAITKLEVSQNAFRTAKELGIGRTTLLGWKNNKDKILHSILEDSGKRKRVIGGGRKVIAEEIDNELADWIRKERLLGNQLSVGRFLLEAKRSMSNYNIKCSNGWKSAFLIRHGFTVRRKTTKIIKDPEK